MASRSVGGSVPRTPVPTSGLDELHFGDELSVVVTAAEGVSGWPVARRAYLVRGGELRRVEAASLSRDGADGLCRYELTDAGGETYRLSAATASTTRCDAGQNRLATIPRLETRWRGFVGDGRSAWMSDLRDQQRMRESPDNPDLSHWTGVRTVPEDLIGFDNEGYPEGWFGIGWSQDFPDGSLVQRKLFGEEILFYRGKDGRLIAMGAYCPHQGAALAVGGRIDGDCVVCPFHGWSWDADGSNAGVPYSSRGRVGVRNKTWVIEEISSHVFIWHSWRSERPTWELPDLGFLSDPEVYWNLADSTRTWLNARLVPQMVTENIVDFSHIKYVHLAEEGSEVEEYGSQDHVFSVVLRQVFRTRSGPVVGKDHIEAHGVGMNIARMAFRDYEITNLLSAVPVDPSHSEMRVTIAVKLPADMAVPESADQLPGRFQRAITAHLDSQDQDMPIWENQIYRANVPWAPEEARPGRALRKWARGLYQSSKTLAESSS
jgi:3-ketosteroid 9alpha-monooxygenase subunit A